MSDSNAWKTYDEFIYGAATNRLSATDVLIGKTLAIVSQHGPRIDLAFLIGLRTLNVYSPNHTYEHVYLSSERYCWQCLNGVQRGHGDVDMATTYKFAEDQYVFTFREFKIPVASVFFLNFRDLRSTGKFLGVTADGRVSNEPAGAFITKASMTFYPPAASPV